MTHPRYIAALTAGLALLAIMVLNLVWDDTGRPWANAILIPAGLMVTSGVALLTRGRGIAFLGYLVLCAGLLTGTVGALLIATRMGWGWPLMVTLPCLAVAGTYLWAPPHPVARALHRTIAGLALLGATVGPAFFLLRADLFAWPEHWWALYLIAAGAVVLGNALELARHRIAYRLQGAALLAGPALITMLLGFRFLTGALPL
ncbi:hypothetical protein J2S43_006243 [Catenuloplanes nepalensis]|uniref:Uncharacterized protein n=1 Tax=Catenuloplanes nepalensis TaxID=587533 RepID=A0ABT9N2P2_9ACTN|nr:hypothetical protein [Catenuloplanes nepalensis]MDP9797731.1 hypothetical protein [Catenuloplanes nepalensis]